MPLEEVQIILAKYGKEEAKIKESLSVRLRSITNNESSIITDPPNVQLQDVIDRNKQILKELELVKGTLRSKAIFNPTEVQWESICKKYKEAPALPITTWRCHMPFYV